VAFYNNRRKQGKDDFEVVFISGDEDQPSFDEYFREMPWLAVPFHDSKRRDALNELFDVEGIPTLVIVGPDGETITSNARGAIESDPQGKNFPYYPSPVEELSQTIESYGHDINSKPALILFMEYADDSEQQDAEGVLLPFAESLAKSKAKSPDGPELLFFSVFGSNNLTNRVRDMVGLPTGKEAASLGPQLVLLDIPDNGGYYKLESTGTQLEVTEKVIGDFIGSFKAGTLTR
jgi:nucleoredoxin